MTSATRTLSPTRWTCIKFPRVEGLDPVAPSLGVVLEPYNRCRSINLGFCPMWTRRRDGQIEMMGAAK